MAFLGSIGKALGIGNLNKGEGWNIARAVFPPIIATELAVQAANKVVEKVGQMGSVKAPPPNAPGSNFYVYGTEQSGGYSHYGPPPAYSVYFAEPGGATQWDYSTSSIPFSIPLAGQALPMDYSTGASGKSWEDFLADSLRRT